MKEQYQLTFLIIAAIVLIIGAFIYGYFTAINNTPLYLITMPILATIFALYNYATIIIEYQEQKAKP